MAVTFEPWANTTTIIASTGGGTVYTTLDKTNFDYFSDTAQVGDCIYFGNQSVGTGVGGEWYDRHPFHHLKLYIGTPLAATSITIVWEYSGGDRFSTAWKTLDVIDGTVNFTQTGEQYVYFHEPRDMQEVILALPAGFVNVKYWVRARITAVTGLTEGGANSTQAVQNSRNEIYVTDYTSDNPATYEDIYTADLAGTRNLTPNLPCTTGMLCLPPLAMEQGALQLNFVLAGTSAGAGDTLDIVGTDAEDNAISESIDVSGGDGTYTSVNCYKTVDHFDCTGWSDGTVYVYQGRWGAFGKYEASKTTYLQEGYIFIDTGCYFSDSDCSVIQFAPGAEGGTFLRVRPGGSVTLGVKSASGYGINGIVFSCIGTATGRSVSTRGIVTFNIYGCMFNSTGFVVAANFEILDSKFTNLLTSAGTGSSIKRCSCTGWQLQSGSGLIIEDIDIINNGAVYTYGDGTKLVGVVSGGEVRPGSGITNQDHKCVDCSFGTWTIPTNCTGTVLYRQYTCGLKVIDGSGNAISGVVVVIADKDGTEIFNDATDVDGEITEQELTYYEYTTNGSSQVNTLKTPHTITISKSGYITQTHKITMDEKKDLVFTLEKQVSVYIGKGKAFVNTNPADGQNNILA